jgi:hypothetical protein
VKKGWLKLINFPHDLDNGLSNGLCKINSLDSGRLGCEKKKQFFLSAFQSSLAIHKKLGIHHEKGEGGSEKVWIER